MLRFLIALSAGLTMDCGAMAAEPLAASASDSAPSARLTQNVVLITLDGLRWQEVFSGADETLMTKADGGVKDIDGLKQRFLRDTAEIRRNTLLPFFWKTIAEQGVIFGNPSQQSKAVVTNGRNFSYPGYSELLCGFADPRVDSNAKKNNENVTVLEWLHRKPGFEGRIAAFCSWDVFPFIINEDRSGIPVNAGWEPLAGMVPSGNGELSPSEARAQQLLQALDDVSLEVPRYFPEVRYDYFTWRGTEEYIRLRKPRVLYVSLGETDDWAHAGRYDLYLDSALRSDQYIERLWQLLQSLPEYRGSTTLILTTDHGRGDNRVDWKSHGEDIADCQYIWMAVLGPDTAPAVPAGTEVTQSQIAATVAACLGFDYCADQPKAAQPLPVLSSADQRAP